MMQTPTPLRRQARPRSARRFILRLLAAMCVLSALGGAIAFYRLSRIIGTPGTGLAGRVREVYRAAFNPRDAFPGKDRLYILGLGIDYNYDSRGILYTKNARSDTIFVASLDLRNRRVGMLSIPRDTRVTLPYGHGTTKINAAHAIGGAPLAKATVEQFLGIQIDHYIVIKVYGTRNFVDAIGGVAINVEKDMDYDDRWGNLHIHLKKGYQRLNGEQAVGYIRFRHDSESDFGRMRRQQELVKAVVRQLMTPSSLLKIDRLVDTVMENVHTDLTRAQLVALAHLFHNVPPERIYTGSVPGYGVREGGVWYLDPSESRKEALVGWLLRGEEWYRNGLVTIRVHNMSGVSDAGSTVREILSDLGYRVILGRASRRARQDTTRVVAVTGKKDVAQQIARLFPNTVVEEPSSAEAPEPGGPDILVYVGGDCARALTRVL